MALSRNVCRPAIPFGRRDGLSVRSYLEPHLKRIDDEASASELSLAIAKCEAASERCNAILRDMGRL